MISNFKFPISDLRPPTSDRDGFWLPQALRERVLADAAWETFWLKGGALATEADPGAIGVRCPKLSIAQWTELLDGLQQARAVGGREVLARWQAVLETALGRLLEQAPAMMATLSACTGYSPEMLARALWHSELISPRLLLSALEFQPTWSAANRWERMPGLPGQARFFPQRTLDRITATWRGDAPLYQPAPPVDLALGYAAGNVPGTALFIALLGGLTNFAVGNGMFAPAVLVRNSRHEPLFAAWVLSIVEEIDPELVAGLAVLIWDYKDEILQRELMRRAGLMIAAAGDETIAALDASRKFAPSLRFHRHGHKVSFAVVDFSEGGRRKAEGGNQNSTLHPPPSTSHSPLPFLSALDSALWDQNGCLSARVHFVKGDAGEYAQSLTEQMRALSVALPRGSTPRRFTHRAFDTYTALQSAGQVRVYSTFDDDFAVILDERAWDADRFSRAVNACMGRVIIVRPIKAVLDVPHIMQWLPPANLQSVSVAMDEDQVLAFAEAAGACGVTAVRSLGRAAFPQLAYSWDGLLPLDMGHLRPGGHFTTIEFDHSHQEIAATFERWAL